MNLTRSASALAATAALLTLGGAALAAATATTQADSATDQQTFAGYAQLPAALQGQSEITQVVYSVDAAKNLTVAVSTANAGVVPKGFKQSVQVDAKVGTKAVSLVGISTLVGSSSYATVGGAGVCAGKTTMVVDATAKTVTLTVPLTCLPKGTTLSGAHVSTHTYTASAMNPVTKAYDVTKSIAATIR